MFNMVFADIVGFLSPGALKTMISMHPAPSLLLVFSVLLEIPWRLHMPVPLYWGRNNLPQGAHFMAAEGNDRTLFELAAELEVFNQWRNLVPKDNYHADQ
jgi:Asp-tRNA(Asn)/Glu-tRNA(Gln) amidotransferase A subunit family amidase